MSNSLIIRPGSDLLSPSNAGRAAQYVRMSTDHQHFSTQNQAAAIAVSAAQHDLMIVRTYADQGRSGLRIQRREGVRYCAEQFDNDGSVLSSIVKNLKRVMAAEYSRELSVNGMLAHVVSPDSDTSRAARRGLASNELP